MNVGNYPGQVGNKAGHNAWMRDTPLDPFPVSASSHPTDTTPLLSEEQRLRGSNADVWQMYNACAKMHDVQLAERWKVQTDSTMIFAGLFSIVVSPFMAEAISKLRSNSTELLLTQISRQVDDPIGTPLSSLPIVLPSYPTKLDVTVNVLWTLSLVLSLTCALSTILVKTWVQEYLYYSQCHPIPSTRARIRAHLFRGLSDYRLDQVISAIPLLLHLAILLFGAGLITCFFSLNNIMAYTALGAYSVIGASYLFLTISPLINPTSPFKTPISNLLWSSLQLVRLSILHATQRITSFVSPDNTFSCFRLPKIIISCQEIYRGGITRALEQDLENTSPNMDAHSLRWAISYMHDDGALESFIAAIPKFLDSEHHCYPQYTIGHLMEDRDVRLGWTIGRLLQTCASSSSALEPHVCKRRAIACMRAIWCVTEKFAGLSSLYWDTLFGAQTAEALSILKHHPDPSIALIAWCTAALAARSCLRELTDISARKQTKGPYWASRAQHLFGFIDKLVAVPLPSDDLESIARDGPLLTLTAFLKTVSHSVAEVDGTVSSMITTTVKHLADGVRAGEATLDTQRLFTSEIFALGTYDCLRHYLDPAASRAVRLTAASLLQELATRIPADVRAADVYADFPFLQEHGSGEHLQDGQQTEASQRRWSYDSSQTVFSGDPAWPLGFLPCCRSPRNDSSLGAVIEVPLSPSQDGCSAR
ncbi:hypothetical protein BJV78DRAFT_1285305 [Lactifluus subvellereus]|nr:hypothetical protein BJV78DRAFT_1285305 [Lactifluus subvellereus]